MKKVVTCKRSEIRFSNLEFSLFIHVGIFLIKKENRFLSAKIGHNPPLERSANQLIKKGLLSYSLKSTQNL